MVKYGLLYFGTGLALLLILVFANSMVLNVLGITNVWVRIFEGLTVGGLFGYLLPDILNRLFGIEVEG